MIIAAPQRQKPKRIEIQRTLLVHVCLPTLMGAFIYILFRKDTLLVFEWLDAMGMTPLVLEIRAITLPVKQLFPAFVLYSIPDGIWVYSATALFGMIWNDSPCIWQRTFWIFLPLVTSVTAEILQFLNIVQGTFCALDILAYFFFFVLVVITIKPQKRSESKCLNQI